MERYSDQRVEPQKETIIEEDTLNNIDLTQNEVKEEVEKKSEDDNENKEENKDEPKKGGFFNIFG